MTTYTSKSFMDKKVATGATLYYLETFNSSLAVSPIKANRSYTLIDLAPG